MEEFEKKLETGNSRHARTDMARTAAFEDADEANVEELFISQRALELEKEIMMMMMKSSDVHLSTKQMTEFFKHTGTATGIMIMMPTKRELPKLSE
jgi:hypothetical protein